MSEGATRSDRAGTADETQDEDRAAEAGPPERDPDGLRIEIAGNGGGYVRVSAGRTIAALVAVVGAISIVAILAYPGLVREITNGAESRRDGREPDRTDGEGGDASEGTTRRQSASDDLGR